MQVVHCTRMPLLREFVYYTISYIYYVNCPADGSIVFWGGDTEKTPRGFLRMDRDRWTGTALADIMVALAPRIFPGPDAAGEQPPTFHWKKFFWYHFLKNRGKIHVTTKKQLKVALRTLTMCNHHLHLVPNFFLHPKTKPHPHLAVTPWPVKHQST